MKILYPDYLKEIILRKNGLTVSEIIITNLLIVMLALDKPKITI